ncbi:MAG: hypothetical protein U0941_30050 [Planctomycetaceae bacterium]
MGVIKFDTIDRGEVYTDNSGKSTLTHRMLIQCSSLDDSISVLRRDLPQFQRWQPHQTEPGFRVDQFRATQRPHSPWWEAQVDYIDTLQKNPLEIPARIGEIKSFTIPGSTLVDHQNKPILNAAGEPPEPFDKPEQIIAFPIIFNIPNLGDWLFDFESCINQDSIRLGSKSCDPLTVMIRQVTVTDTQEADDIEYRTATLECWRRKSKWVEYWPNRGFNERIKGTDIPFHDATAAGLGANDSVLRPILIDGERPSEPQFLDKDGKWIKNPTLDQIVIIATQLYPAISFASQFPAGCFR